MYKVAKFFIALLVGVSLFYFVVRETGIETVWQAASIFFGWEGVMILIVTSMIIFLGALRWREVLRFQGEEVSLFKTTRYLIKGFTVDFLTPFSLFGGEAVRIFLMGKEVGIKKSSFSSITDKIMDVTAHLFFLLVGTVLFLFYGASHTNILFLYGVVAIVFIFLILFLFYRRAFCKKSFLQWLFGTLKITKNYLNTTENGRTIVDAESMIIDFFSGNKKEFIKGMIFSFLRHFLFLFRIFLILYFILGTTSPGVAIIVYGLNILSMLLPLPASLGGLEVILALGFSTLGISFAAGVVTAITLRSADLFVCFLGMILFARLSFKSFYEGFNDFLKRGL